MGECVHVAESLALNFKGCSGTSAKTVGTDNRSLCHTRRSGQSLLNAKAWTKIRQYQKNEEASNHT